MCLLHFPCLAGTKHVGFELQIYENPAKKRIYPQEDASVTSPMSGSELEVVAYQDEEAAVAQLHVGVLRKIVEAHVVAHSAKKFSRNSTLAPKRMPNSERLTLESVPKVSALTEVSPDWASVVPPSPSD